MRKPLTIAVAQPRIVSYDVAANAASHADAVRAARARVVVFPELSITGYHLDAPAIAAEDSRLAPIIAACGEMKSLALVGAPVHSGDGGESAGGQSEDARAAAGAAKGASDRKGGGSGEAGGKVDAGGRVDAPRVYIAMLAIDASGARVAYRKMWLGTEEAKRFTPGGAPAVLAVDGWRLGLAICKDTGVAQHAADTAALGMDAYVAGTVKHAHEAALQEERARRVATDHGVWVAVASFAGSTGGGFRLAAGRSAIWSPAGEPLAQAGPDPGAIARATLP